MAGCSEVLLEQLCGSFHALHSNTISHCAASNVTTDGRSTPGEILTALFLDKVLFFMCMVENEYRRDILISQATNGSKFTYHNYFQGSSVQ